MSLRERGGAFETLENLQEDLVIDTINEVLTYDEFKGKICTCDICLVDMAAIALNALPPRYVADRYNKFPATEEEENMLLHMVGEIVLDAVRKVGTAPHHNAGG